MAGTVDVAINPMSTTPVLRDDDDQEHVELETLGVDAGGGSDEETGEAPQSNQERSWWRTAIDFVGPGHVVAVGYMDPGNWATDVQAGSYFGYSLLMVVLVSSVIAVVLQLLTLRLGIITGRDLAELQRDHLPRWASRALWVLAEACIIATDLAEVIGGALALNLLFGLPLWAGVVITAADVVLILMGLQKAMWLVELVIAALVMTLFACFAFLIHASPNVDYTAIIMGYLPSAVLFTNADAIFIGIGIIGATVMPHNLYIVLCSYFHLIITIYNNRYLHSALSRDHAKQHPKFKSLAVRWSTIDISFTLFLAFIVNSSILIVAAANFYARCERNVEDIPNAYNLLAQHVSFAVATVFAVGLLLSGQSATITGTLAGQVVAEGFLNWTIAPWLQRLCTRLMAVIPALIVVLAAGPESLNFLLVISQVILSLLLPFAMFPLIYFTSSKELMGEYVNHFVGTDVHLPPPFFYRIRLK